ncbi:MAG: hypothetical protein IPM23_04330 [Candidatus Melainabacteria bacterium]|nr:hypothetical protein [Candidatus Melainabacteria bacterium]
MYADFLFPGGVNRMWFVANGFVQNEQGQWVRRDELPAASPPSSAPEEPEEKQKDGDR